MLIGLAAKNAILIVEFAKAEYEKGKPLMDAALEGARLRLRPILMTSFAFICGLSAFVVRQWLRSRGASDPRLDGHWRNDRRVRHRDLSHPGNLLRCGATLFTRARHRSSATAGARGRASRGTAIMTDSGYAVSIPISPQSQPMLAVEREFRVKLALRITIEPS